MFGNLNGNKQYILSYHITQSNNTFKPSFIFRYTDGTALNCGNNGTLDYDVTQTSQTGKVIKCISIGWQTQAGGGTVTFSNIMLREVNTDDTVIEHEEQTATFPLEEGQVLRESDYLADDGIHHKRKTIVLDGTENWGLHKNSIFKLAIADIKPTNNFTLLGSVNSISSHFKGITWREMYDTENIGIAVHNTAKNIYISTEKTVTTVEQFKTWLAEQYANGTPIMVEYELQDEEIEAYTEEQQEAYDKINELYSYQEVTHITCEDEIKANMKLSYFSKNDTVLENKGYVESKPIIIIHGTGNIAVSLNNSSVFSIDMQSDASITIDAIQEDAYQGSILKNRQMNGEFDKIRLKSGENTISWTGNLSKIEIEPKSRWL